MQKYEGQPQNPEPISIKIIKAIESANSPIDYPISAIQLRELFEIQAKLDNSEDQPELQQNSIFKITDGVLIISSAYTISDLKGGRTNVTISGAAVNNEKGDELSNKTPAIIDGSQEVKQRTFDAFGVTERFSLKTYLTAMIEDSFQGQINIPNMHLDGQNLVLTIQKPET